MELGGIGRILLNTGFILIGIGVLFMLSDKIPFGKLPGDFRIGRGSFKIFIPVTTSIIISIVITLMANFISRR